MPWPSSAVNSGPRRFSQAHSTTETRRNSQPTCSTAFCSSPVGRPDLQSQAQCQLINREWAGIRNPSQKSGQQTASVLVGPQRGRALLACCCGCSRYRLDHRSTCSCGDCDPGGGGSL